MNRQMKKMMAQAQKMQQDMMKAQEELAQERVEGSSGGGMVKVTVTGQSDVVGIKISPEVVDSEDVEMLEDMILAAVNDAVEKSKTVAEKKMGRLGVPGGLGGLM
ncbi:MAG: YbaB/EbfC family nucleoid-associated protein [Candidatus Fermentibacteraceae bacterium]|nr:YbaB/EbfC family nucleoid-associated protein [Candidatus Fermentibacteraceae bacterium]